MKNILSFSFFFFMAQIAAGQQDPAGMIEQLKTGCANKDKEELASLLLQEGNHAKVATLMADAYLDGPQYRAYIEKLKNTYGDRIKKDMPMSVAVYLSVLSHSPCDDNVEMDVVEKEDGGKLIKVTSDDWSNQLTIKLNLVQAEGHWAIEQKMKKEDYSDIIALLVGAKKSMVVGKSLLKSGASYEDFIIAMQSIDADTMAQVK